MIKKQIYKKCIDCGEKYIVKSNVQKRCQECRKKNTRKAAKENGIIDIQKCSVCGKEVKLNKWRIEQGFKYCSVECKRIGMKGKEPWNKGLTKENDIRVASYAKTLSDRGIRPIQPKGYKHSKETREKISEIQTGVPRLNQRGEKSHRWKGGLTSESMKQRNSLEYRQWRKAVFERDNYTCQICGEVGGKLNADHIKSFAYFPELRFDVDNGRTLCLECHKKTDNFAGKSIRDLEKFKN